MQYVSLTTQSAVVWHCSRFQQRPPPATHVSPVAQQPSPQTQFSPHCVGFLGQTPLTSTVAPPNAPSLISGPGGSSAQPALSRKHTLLVARAAPSQERASTGRELRDL